MMSPLMLRMLLDFYTGPTPFENSLSGVHNEAFKFLMQNKTIELCENSNGLYKTTHKGNAWVELIVDTEMPVVAYVRKNDPGKKRYCPSCNGQGKIGPASRLSFCDECNGIGYFLYEEPRTKSLEEILGESNDRA